MNSFRFQRRLRTRRVPTGIIECLVVIVARVFAKANIGADQTRPTGARPCGKVTLRARMIWRLVTTFPSAHHGTLLLRRRVQLWIRATLDIIRHNQLFLNKIIRMIFNPSYATSTSDGCTRCFSSSFFVDIQHRKIAATVKQRPCLELVKPRSRHP